MRVPSNVKHPRLSLFNQTVPSSPYNEPEITRLVHKGDINRLHKRIDKLEMSLGEVSPRRV